MAIDSQTINQIIAQLQATTTKLAEVSEEVDISAESLAIHNADPDAHAQIRALIANINAVSLTELTAAITAHSTSATAHADIRTLISNLNTAVTNVTAMVGDGVAAHDTSEIAHADIRLLITNLTTIVDSINTFYRYIEQLPALFGDDPAAVSPLDEIKTQVEDVTNLVAESTQSVTLLSTRMVSLAAAQSTTDSSLNDTNDIMTTVTNNVIEHDVSIKTVELNSSFANQMVDLFGINNNFPVLVNKSGSAQFSIQGVTVPSGETLSISLDPVDSGFTFSKTAGIAQGEVVTASIPSNAIETNLYYFIATITLGVSGNTSRYAIVTRINSVPDITNLKDTVPVKGEPGMSYEVAFWGAYDIDGQKLSYNLVPLTGNLTFSKTTDISAYEPIQLNVPATLPREATATFRLDITDTLGLVSSKTYSLMAAALPDSSGLVHNIPSVLVPGKSYAISLSGATSPDGSALTYSIGESGGNVITFSRTSDILENGITTMTVPSSVVRGSAHTIRISIVTALGSITTVDVPVTINVLPDTSSALFSLPDIVCPNNVNDTGFNGMYSGCSLSGIAEVNSGQPIRLAINCNDTANVSFSKSSDLTQTELFAVNIGANAARGTTLTFTVTVSDGLETTTKTFTRTVNRVPSTPVATGLPTEVESESTIALSFGSNDADGNAVKFFIGNSSPSGIVASKSTGIDPGEQVNFTFPKVTATTPATIEVVAYNVGLGAGGAALVQDWNSSSKRTLSLNIKPSMIVDPPEILTPTEGAVLSSDVVTFNISAISSSVAS